MTSRSNPLEGGSERLVRVPDKGVASVSDRKTQGRRMWFLLVVFSEDSRRTWSEVDLFR